MMRRMLSSAAQTVASYLASLPEQRREPIARLRQLISKRLPAGFEECMEYGMISYVVPLSRYPKTYNGKPLALASLASQKQYMSLYLMSVYGDPETERWLSESFQRAGKRLDMGKSCVRFKSLEDLPLDVIGDVIARVSLDQYIARYERARGLTVQARVAGAGRAAPATKQATARNGTRKKKAAKKAARSKAAFVPRTKAAKKRGRA